MPTGENTAPPDNYGVTPTTVIPGIGPAWSMRDAATIFNVHPQTIRRKCSSREWPSVEILGRVWLTAEHFQQIVALGNRPRKNG